MRLKREWKFVLAFLLEVLTIILGVKFINNVPDNMNIFCMSAILFAINFNLLVSLEGK